LTPDEHRRLHLAVVREVSDEWVADGRVSVPPDDTSGDDDGAFCDEVERRFNERIAESES
jgi:hypothetical protein